MKQIVLASGNHGKVREFGNAFASLGIEVVPITQFAPDWHIAETGHTFYANAQLKAEAAMNLTGFPTLADDSGLVVYYLGGAPGVYSQRFAGESATDEMNNSLLLEQLANARERRQAHFVAVLAYAAPGRTTQFAVGRLFGSIIAGPRGNGGFGYDPIFEVRGLGKTLAEMSLAEKNLISHRAQALRALVEVNEIFGA